LIDAELSMAHWFNPPGIDAGGEVRMRDQVFIQRPFLDDLAAGQVHKNGIILHVAFCRRCQVQDVDWDTQDGHYRVRIHGEWIVLPDAAVVTEPNRFGPTVVWPYNDRYGNTQIRCFMPGAGT
jgi:hypothetical protein